MKTMGKIFIILGILGNLNTIQSSLYTNTFGWFQVLLFIFEMGVIAFGVFMHTQQIKKVFSNPFINRIIIFLGIVGVIFFATVEGIIIKNAYHKPEKGADYIIVLGAKVNGTYPSKVLIARLDIAIQYLNENPKTKAIVSGGQGPFEEITEAQAMYEYLVTKGIHPNRIIQENKSEDTEQNLDFSAKFLDKKDKVIIVSNGFHIYRALHLAKDQGYKNVEGYGAKTTKRVILNLYTREFFAVIIEVFLP